MMRSLAALTLGTALLAANPASAAGIQHFSVTEVRQVEVGALEVRAYLDLLAADGRAVTALPDDSVSATLGEWQTDLLQVAPFDSADQGVAYVFLVDVSRSLNDALFQQLAGSIETWIDSLGPSDRAAIIAFGESSRRVVDFTGERRQLLAGLRSLGPTDDETLLHQALADALDLCRRLDPDLPGRRTVVVFSDGKDEGSGLEADDVLADLRSHPAPIYAIGYSRLRDVDERREHLDLLRRFATNSGGAFFAAEQTNFAEAYDSIREAIGRVWMADFRCASCRLDGRVHRLQVRLALDGQVLSDGGAVRLLPLARTATQVVEPPGIEGAAEGRLEPSAEPAETTAVESGSRSPSSLWLGLVVVAIAIGALVTWRTLATRRRARRERIAAVLDLEATSGGYRTPLDPRKEPSVLDPPLPPPMPSSEPSSEKSSRRAAGPVPPPPETRTVTKGPPKQVRLVVVRGSRRGRQYSFVVDEQATVGKRSDCDCVLGDETGIDAVQFELIVEDGGLFIRNLSESTPTLLVGRPIVGKVRISSDALVGTGEIVLRVVFH